MFKIAYCAGHYLGTPGKCVPSYLDPHETREWTLNDQIARHFASAAHEYEDVEILRTDDSTGNTFIDIPERTDAANKWDADLYLDFHHNAGIGGGNGGGVEAYSYPGSESGRAYRDAVYATVIAAGKLRGNRANPLQEKRFDSLSLSHMPAVLVEYGYMDSRTDAPIILDEAYSKIVAYATMDGIAKVAGLVKKTIVDATPAEALTVDGLWGYDTTSRLQQIFGVTVDGVVSNQLSKYRGANPGLCSGWDWNDAYNGRGSLLIKTMQNWAGMPASKQDGLVGPDTISYLQRKFGTPVDGKVSYPSQMVKALQRWANEQ